jgi:glucosamine-6-phosphate deaminase
MTFIVHRDKIAAGAAAANDGAAAVRAALGERSRANIVLATGTSQFEMLDALVREPQIDWHRVTAFHLDEYVAIPVSHRASFRLYLWQRFVTRLPLPLRAFHWIDGEADPARECARLGAIVRRHPIDVAFVGIGENGHLAFNDPPADFETDEPYIVVELDEACRRQQLGEGWFQTLDDVPRRAISMSVRQILSARKIVCTVPDSRKAEAIRAAVEGPVTPLVPASILQRHPDATLHLDADSASLLKARA